MNIKEKETISIVTICFNCASIIEKTILSVLNQNYDFIEYIIIDGGSNDGTQDIIRKYETRISYWVSEPDKGIYDAMNKGIQRAQGEWICFLNAGDFFHSNNALSQFVKKINKDTTIAYGLIRYFTPVMEYDMEYIPIEKMAYLDPIPHPATLTRLSYHKEHPFDITFRSSGDYDFFYRAYFDNHARFQYIPLVLTDYDNATGASKDNLDSIWVENKRVWARHASIGLILKMHIMRLFSYLRKSLSYA